MTHDSTSQEAILSGPHKFSEKRGYVPVKDFTPSEYPKWKYKISGKTKMVQNAEQEDALGKGWFDSPAAASVAAKEREEKLDKKEK